MKPYKIKEFVPGKFHIVDPNGHLVYDNEPNGNDKPLVFTDEDTAYEFIHNLVNDD